MQIKEKIVFIFWFFSILLYFPFFIWVSNITQDELASILYTFYIILNFLLLVYSFNRHNFKNIKTIKFIYWFLCTTNLLIFIYFIIAIILALINIS